MATAKTFPGESTAVAVGYPLRLQASSDRFRKVTLQMMWPVATPWVPVMLSCVPRQFAAS